MSSETRLIQNRYKKRPNVLDSKYSRLNHDVMFSVHERQRLLIDFLGSTTGLDLNRSAILDVGCGAGVNLLDLITLGANPDNITGIDILPDRLKVAHKLLPKSVILIEGDISVSSLSGSTFDFIFVSLVFSSVLDPGHRKLMAEKIWSLLKPGGSLFWYDFIYNNPSNPDVSGVPLDLIKKLFPYASIQTKKITLAPPIARRLTKLNPSLYWVFNLFPFLRTHLFCKVTKL